MRETFDRFATAASIRFSDWIRAHVDESRRDWASAMSAELESIDSGWGKLAWVVGALPLVWSFRRRARTRIARNLIGGSQMEANMTAGPPPWRDAFTRNLSVFFACYLGAVVVVGLTAGVTLLLGGKILSLPVEIVVVAAYATCSIVSLARGAAGASCLFAALGASFAAEFGYYNTSGNYAIPTVSSQLAVFSMAILCVSAGAMISRRSSRVLNGN
jgi:hypothetical protein